MSEKYIAYTVGQLKRTQRNDFVEKLSMFTNELNLKFSTSQVKSWEDCYDYLKNEFQNI